VERARRVRIHAKTTVLVVVAAQIVSGAALAGVFAAGGDSKAAYSALTGTLSGALPNFYLALKMFSVATDAPPDRLLRVIYVGETLKIVFAASMLAAAVVVLDVSVPYLLAGYGATVVVQWFALLMPASGPTTGPTGGARGGER
jgi:F0F1-type ATP synthase assembly protein I